MTHQLVELSIELTNECNMACLHCSSGSTPQKVKGELTCVEHIELIKQARDLGATVLSLSGGNPLLYPKIPLLVAEAAMYGYKRVLLYVTGHNQDGDYVYQHPDIWTLVDLPVTWIFSLHSHHEDINDWIMNRAGALEAIKSSIGWLKRLDCEVEVHMVPMRPNYRHIPGVRILCNNLGVSKLSLLRFVPQTRGKANEDELGMTIQQFANMQMFMHYELTQRDDYPVELRLGCPIDFRHACGLLTEKERPCHAGDDLILVRPNGDVHPCAAWKSLPSDSNVREAPLVDIWEHSATFHAIREFKAGSYSLVYGCQGCDHLASCMGGCPAQRLHAYGKRLSDMLSIWSDPLCPRGQRPAIAEVHLDEEE